MAYLLTYKGRAAKTFRTLPALKRWLEKHWADYTTEQSSRMDFMQKGRREWYGWRWMRK